MSVTSAVSRSETRELWAGALSEATLLREYARTRSPQLREELVERFAGLAKSMALRYRSSPESLEDLTQIAMIALVNAIDRYEPGKGSFKSFAVTTILGELRHHLRDRVSPIHLRRRLQELILQVNGTADELTGRLGRQPTAIEIAEEIGVSLERVVEALDARHARRQVSLDNAFESDGDQASPVDRLAWRELGFDRVEASLAISQVCLTPREREAVNLYYVKNLKQREIGEVLGISQMQVSRVLRGALEKMLASVRGRPAQVA